MLGLLLAVGIFMPLYVAGDGDIATPTVALILTGTFLIGMLPNSISQIGMSVVVIGLGAAFWQILQKYVLSPATQ